MSMKIVYRFRIALATVVGVTIALATASGIFLQLTIDPESLQLADRIDASHTILYLATNKRETVMHAISRYKTVLNDEGPSESDITIADQYEFALLRTQSGTLVWIIEERNEKQERRTRSSLEDPSLFLPVSQRRQSVGSSPLFEHVTQSQQSLAWFDIEALPIPESASSSLVRAVLSSFEVGLVQFDTSDRGTLLLQKKKISESWKHANIASVEDVLLSISLSDPTALLLDCINGLATRDQAFLEGLTGIVQATMQKLTGSTDLATMGADLLAGPLSIQLTQRSKNTILFAISGTAKDAKKFTEWSALLRSMQEDGHIRTMDFYNNEYSRTDVVSKQTHSSALTEEYDGWTLEFPEGTHQEGSLMTALHGRKFILGNSETLMKSTIDATSQILTSGIGAGSLDMTWAIQEAETRLPFLAPISETIHALFGSIPARLRWRISTIPSGIRVDWQIQ